jgi:phosphate-selective porin OprO/OprP
MFYRRLVLWLLLLLPATALSLASARAQPGADEEGGREGSAESAQSDLPETNEPTIKVSADENGFRIRSGEKHPQFALKIGALVQVDGRVFFGNRADQQRDDMLLRRARPKLSGTLLGIVDYKLVTDFGDADVELTDASVELHPFDWLRLRVGKFKALIGLERLQSDANLVLPERALDANLASSRDVGALLWGELVDGMVLYQVAVFDGAPDNSKADRDNGKHKDGQARVFVRPFVARANLGDLGLGFAVSAGRRDGSTKDTSLSSLKTTGQGKFFSYSSSDSDPTATVYARGQHVRMNPNLFYYYRAFGLLGELVLSRQELRRDTLSMTLLHRAWHATASYVIAGQNNFDGGLPTVPWNPRAGHYGALELGLRYSRIVLDGRTFPGFADSWTAARAGASLGGAVNWVLSDLFRITGSFERMSFLGGAGSSGKVRNRASENALIVRMQVSM